MKHPSRVKVFKAPRILLAPGSSVADGGLLVKGDQVVRILRSAATVRRAVAAGASCVELEGCTLVPGLVNAHAHLELSGLRGRLPSTVGFVTWIRALMRERPRRGTLQTDAMAGARRALETGTTTVGDIDSSGAMQAFGSKCPLRIRIYREVLDAWNPDRTAGALARIRRALPKRRAVNEGISPHAPFSTSDALLSGVRAIARRRAVPLVCHWSETEEEVEWLRSGKGDLATLLGTGSPRATGLDLLERADLVGPTMTLIHGNHPERGELGRIARAGMTIVHCPGTHVFFGREAFDWERYDRAGVRVALGTDSLASNEDLDMRREMSLLREAAPWMSPDRVFGMATVNGALAIGLGGRVGELRPGAAADLVALTGATSVASTLEELTLGNSEVRGVWVGGKPRVAFRR